MNWQYQWETKDPLLVLERKRKQRSTQESPKRESAREELEKLFSDLDEGESPSEQK